MPDQTPFAAAAGHHARIQERLRELQLKSLDAAEGVLDSLKTSPPAPPALPLTVARRQMANILGVPGHCHRRRCRRMKTCDGEPVHCLSACLPALPDGVLMRILSVKAVRQRMRKR